MIQKPVFHVNILGFATAIQLLRHCCSANFKIQQKKHDHAESQGSYFELDYFGALLLISS